MKIYLGAVDLWKDATLFERKDQHILTEGITEPLWVGAERSPLCKSRVPMKTSPIVVLVNIATATSQEIWFTTSVSPLAGHTWW